VTERERALEAATAPAALPAGSIPTQRGTEEAAVDLLAAVESQPDDVAHLLRGWLSDGPSSAAGAR
jgi:flagellar biosynthesis/type III secretory pathway M-ring protein FliF/YscJ